MTKEERKARQRAEQIQSKRRQLADLRHKAELTTAAVADLAASLGPVETEDGQASYPRKKCLRDQLEKYGDPATAEKVCGAIRAGKAADPAHVTEAEYKAIEAELGIQRKWDSWDDGYPTVYRPYGGATSIGDALAAMDAQEQAAAIQRAAWIFQDITSNILYDPTIDDKAKAISAAANELQKLLKDPTPLLKDAEPQPAPASEAKVAPAPEPMSTDMPLTQSGSFQVFKGLDGQFYALGRVTNKWRDRDIAKHPKGEIITDAAHKEFVSYLNGNPDQAPELWSWHTPGTARKSRAVWWDYADGFVTMLWPLEESEAKQFDPGETLGMSHGFFALARDGGQGLITKYRSFEGSELPPEWTANPWTSLEVMKEAKAMSFSPDQRNFLVKRFGEERVIAIEADTANLAKALDALGVESKDASALTCPGCKKAVGATDKFCPSCGDSLKAQGKEGEIAPAAAAAPAGEAAEAALDTIKQMLDVDGLNAVITTLQKQNQDLAAQAGLVPELQKQLASLDAAVKQLGKSDDEKVAEQIQPRLKPMRWGFQASADDKSKLTDKEKEQFKDKKPASSEGKETSWVGEVFSPIGAPAA